MKNYWCNVPVVDAFPYDSVIFSHNLIIQESTGLYNSKTGLCKNWAKNVGFVYHGRYDPLIILWWVTLRAVKNLLCPRAEIRGYWPGQLGPRVGFVTEDNVQYMLPIWIPYLETDFNILFKKRCQWRTNRGQIGPSPESEGRVVVASGVTEASVGLYVPAAGACFHVRPPHHEIVIHFR